MTQTELVDFREAAFEDNLGDKFDRILALMIEKYGKESIVEHHITWLTNKLIEVFDGMVDAGEIDRIAINDLPEFA